MLCCGGSVTAGRALFRPCEHMTQVCPACPPACVSICFVTCILLHCTAVSHIHNDPFTELSAAAVLLGTPESSAGGGWWWRLLMMVVFCKVVARPSVKP